MKPTLEHVADVLRDLGLSDHVGAVLDALTKKPQRTPGAIRQARYREKHESASQIALCDAQSDVTERLRAFGEAWNVLAGQFKLPQIDEIKSGSMRERHALARLRDLESPDDLLNHVRGSPYLRGEINGFRATFDWIINVSNCQKIMDGNYEDRERNPTARTPYRGSR